MGGGGRRTLTGLVLLACLAGTAGCRIERTHARPGGLLYFTGFGRHPGKLDVRVLKDPTSPVNTPNVLIVTVLDEDGKPRRDRRVEWLLEGAGHILEVDESGYLPSRGYKVDNRYAVSHTDYLEHVVERHTGRP